MKFLIGVILGVFLVFVAISGIKNNDNTEKTGSLYIGLTDYTADINNVNDINMSVNKVEVYSNTKGWITLSSERKNYNLLELKASGKVEFYTNKNIEAGSYERVRVSLGDTIVKTKTKGDIKAVLPSNQIVMNTRININSNSDSYVKLDFLADKSLHMTADAKYVFAPVVKMETRSNTKVEVKSNKEIIVLGGKIDSNIEVGVDLDGSSKSNFNLKTDNTLKIESSIDGALKFMLGGQTMSSNNLDIRDSESSNNSINVNTSSENSSSAESSSSIKIEGSLDNKIKLGN